MNKQSILANLERVIVKASARKFGFRYTLDGKACDIPINSLIVDGALQRDAKGNLVARLEPLDQPM